MRPRHRLKHTAHHAPSQTQSLTASYFTPPLPFSLQVVSANLVRVEAAHAIRVGANDTCSTKKLAEKCHDAFIVGAARDDGFSATTHDGYCKGAYYNNTLTVGVW